MTRVLTPREKTILYLTIVIIIFSIVFNLLIMPILTKNKELNREINLIKTKLKKYLYLLNQKEDIQNKYQKFFSSFAHSTTDEGTMVGILSELENLAKTAKIRIIDIRPQTPKVSALYKETVIDIKTEGTVEDYFKFIYNLANSLFLLRIKKIQLMAKPNTDILEGIFSIAHLLVSE